MTVFLDVEMRCSPPWMRFLSEPQAKSFPEVSPSLCFERKWSSLYQAFQDGRMNEKSLRDIFVRYLPKADAGKWVWIGIDASKIARPDAVTEASRTAQQVHNLPECKKPITFGWQFSTVVVLPEEPSSWTYVLDQQRVASKTTAIEVALVPLKRLVAHLPKNALIVLDRGYDANWLWCQGSSLGIGVLCRLKNNRCLYRPAPPPTGKKGGRGIDGAQLQPTDATTHAHPDGTWSGTDNKGRPVEITWWKHLHVKPARWLDVTVIRVVRPHATNKERDPRVSWFAWIGDAEVDIAQIGLGYARRFGQEHGYRFDKQALLWETPRLRTDIRSLSAGAIVLPLPTIIWYWPAIWSKENCALGKTSSASQARNRCDAGSASCCHVWAPLLNHPNLAENRKAGPKGQR